VNSVLPTAAESVIAIRAGWILLLVLWGTTIVALLLAAWRTLRPSGDARRLHNGAAVALVGCVLLLMATPLLAGRMASSRPAPVLSARLVPLGQHSAVLFDTRAALITPVPQASPMAPNRVAGLLGLIWIGGVAVLLARLGTGWIVAQGMRRRAARVADPSAQDTLDSVCRHFGISREVGLLCSMEVEAPVVLGVRRPALLLPTDLAARMPQEALAPLLAHECAHISRHDYAVNLAQRVVDALLFFSPAVRWVSQRLREAREFYCDDAAVQFCAADRGRYVRVLTTLASLGSRAHGRAVLGSTGPRLITRVRRLVSEDTMLRPSVSRVGAVLVALAMLGSFAPPILRLSAAHLSSLPLPAADPSGLETSDSTPVNWVRRQPGSPLTLGPVEATADHNSLMATISNNTDTTIEWLQFVAVVSARAAISSSGVRLFLSSPIRVNLEVGAMAYLETGLAEAMEHGRAQLGPDVQVMLGLKAARFADGNEWSMTPNPAARTAEEAFGFPPADIPRALITAHRSGSSGSLCYDEERGEFSQGAVVSVRNEPGRFARCVDGAWIDHTVRQEIASAVPQAATSPAYALDLALSQPGAPVALRGYTASGGTFLYETATLENLSSKPIASVSLGVLVVDQSAPQSRSMVRGWPVPVNLGPGDTREVTISLLPPWQLEGLIARFKGTPRITIGVLDAEWADGSKWQFDVPQDALDFSTGSGRRVGRFGYEGHQSGDAGSLSARDVQYPVSVTAFEDLGLKITGARIVTEANTAAVEFEATNVTNRSITDYSVRVYVYRSNVRPTGFRGVQFRDPLDPGTRQTALVPLRELTLEPGSIVLMAVSMMSFEDGVRWREPVDAVERVKLEAARLAGRAAPPGRLQNAP
jgi:beta-lactamase regulating signal transducer with metallopeptidase domain